MAPAPAAATASAAEEEARRPTATAAASGADAAADDAPLPVIDLARYAENGSELARDLRRACETVGFFFLENHGVPAEVVERAFAAGRAFFALPEEAKMRCRATTQTKNRGWTPPEAETLDPARQPKRGDLKEGFYVGREVEQGSRMASLPLHGPNVWPSEDGEGEDGEGGEGGGCRGFRKACERYHASLLGLARRLLPAVAEAAGAPSVDAFVAAVFGEHGGGDGGDGDGDGDGNDKAAAALVPYSSGPMAFTRLLSYLPEASEAEAGVLGCGAHSDWGMLTFLATDGSPGLQVLRRGRRRAGGDDGEGGGGNGDGNDGDGDGPSSSSYWQDVPPRPGAFVVNVGDMLERWTAGRLRSTVHRVVVPAREAEAGRRRQSIAFFLDPSFSALIGNGEGRYAPVRAGEYLLQRYRDTHAGFEGGGG